MALSPLAGRTQTPFSPDTADSTSSSPPSSSPSAARDKTPPHLSTGTRFGVVSPSLSLNQMAYHWLKHGGTVWDALTVVVFQLLLYAPHIASFDSDVALLSFQKDDQPRLYWFSNFDEFDPPKTSFYPYSRWAPSLIARHLLYGRFPIQDLLAIPKLQTENGWKIPDEFQRELASLANNLRIIKEIPFKEIQKSKKMSEYFDAIVSRKPFFPTSAAAQNKLIADKLQQYAPGPRATAQSKMAIPGKTDWAYTHNISVGNDQLFGPDNQLLDTLKRRIDRLYGTSDAGEQTRRSRQRRRSDALDAEDIFEYFSQDEFPEHPRLYQAIFHMTMFDQHGNLVAFTMGIPMLETAFRDNETGMIGHQCLNHLRERFWTLSPYALWNKEQGIKAVLSPKISNLTSFIQSFPILITQKLLDDKKYFYELINETPQLFSPSLRKLFISHGAHRNFQKRFWHNESFPAPIRYIGFEIMPDQVIGFSSAEMQITPFVF